MPNTLVLPLPLRAPAAAVDARPVPALVLGYVSRREEADGLAAVTREGEAWKLAPVGFLLDGGIGDAELSARLRHRNEEKYRSGHLSAPLLVVKVPARLTVCAYPTIREPVWKLPDGTTAVFVIFLCLYTPLLPVYRGFA
jgi:hypothetical protein